jgi:hypothetical protein
MGDLRFANLAALRDQHILQFTILHRGAWQKTGVGIDW